jgi:cysteine desulfurase/selenocysteine lyase
MNSLRTEADWETLRERFPVLARSFDSRPLTFLDSTATTQKPIEVMEVMDRYYREHYSSVKRGVYRLSEETTQLFEACRRKVAAFVGAHSENEIIFTRGTTESLNLVAQAWGGAHLGAGDEVVLTTLEHHANLVPWQMVAQRTGAVLRFAPCLDTGDLDFEAFALLLGPKTKAVAFTHIANSLGVVHPVAQMVAAVRRICPDACIVLDAAQSSGHSPLNFQELDVDFAAFSGHKIYGPTGIGVLYGKYSRLLETPPWQGGGEMIDEVRLEGSTYALPPARFEAGTPAIAEVLGLSVAIDFLNEIGFEQIQAREHELTEYLVAELQKVPSLRLIGTPQERAGIASFVMDCAHPHDIAMILDEEAIAVRSGHHCAQPVMQRFGVPATVRASIGVYNTHADIDRLIKALHRVVRLFGN